MHHKYTLYQSRKTKVAYVSVFHPHAFSEILRKRCSISRFSAKNDLNRRQCRAETVTSCALKHF